MTDRRERKYRFPIRCPVCGRNYLSNATDRPDGPNRCKFCKTTKFVTDDPIEIRRLRRRR